MKKFLIVFFLFLNFKIVLCYGCFKEWFFLCGASYYEFVELCSFVYIV